ncbi:Fe-S cluster assembly protein SufD [Streptomonospora nanhaiensis]|uniref:Fe-S cluster assembly protein SufD n=1 Tax=Streptomonospora nanhaiensis TaxID=1323731 RepID=A0A853BGR8_9ACTN|nr:Fe-S cluster assembly protein SufD [Streptomonospora nanhaiensis]MBV2364728.1 Fe-S cluster assembly protein SufD [Streptomonospora nanhaiensis]MBX9389353.1 Fe-S cluster assembly protein SufD [Streptomonospora nanhaiensis]NYI93736.1 Fe-S cluster assembly protein SufD [Streptomonospora nanhaiensis]
MASPNLGIREHSHGAGEIPISRLDVHGSFDPQSFPVPTGREEEWRFTPLRRLRGLHDGRTIADGVVGVEVQAPAEVRVEQVDRDDPRVGASFLPNDRVSALAWDSFPQFGRANLVTVPKGTEAGAPVFIKATGTTHGDAYGHTVVRAEPQSAATVVLEYAGSAVYADNVEFVVEDGASLTVISLQDWDRDAVHVSHQFATVGRDARFRSFVVTLGGDLVRLSPSVRYVGTGGDAELHGLYYTGKGQHHEHRSLIDHNESNTRSRVEYKGALSGEDAHAVWIGDVIIGEGTSGTDSYEHNRNLVLTDGTRVDSVPNLEIFTGEVEGAGHASASGRLDDIHLFYLQSRGIPADEARRLVIRGFFQELINRIEVPELRERIMTEVEEKLGLHE